MDKYEELKQIHGHLDGLRNAIDGMDLDLSKKEDLELLIDIKREMDDLILKAAVYQAFQEECCKKAEMGDDAKVSEAPLPICRPDPQTNPLVIPPDAQQTVPPVISQQPLETSPEPILQQAETQVERPLHTASKPVKAVTSQDKKEVFSENSVGKYLIGVLASLLILVGVAVLAATIWNYIPDTVKFSMVLLMGLLMGGLGFLLGTKGKTFNAFHLSLIGCGTGIIYCDLIAAKLAWSLFPDPAVLLFFIVWTISGFVLSKKLHSDIMFSIIQIGNAISILLTVHLMEIGPSLWLILLFILCTVVLTSVFAGQGFHKANGLAASYIAIFSYLMICSRLGELMRDYPTDSDTAFMVTCGILFMGLFLFSACLFWMIPYGIRGFSDAAEKCLVASQLLILAAGTAFIMVQLPHSYILDGRIAKPAPEILYFLILMAALFKKKTRTFSLMVLSVNMTAVLMDLSSFFFESWGLLPCVLCLVFLLLGLHLKDIWMKIGAVVIYAIITCGILLFSFINLFTNAFNSELNICILHGLMILIPCIVIADIVKHRERALKRKILAVLCLDSAVCYIFLMFFNLELWMMWSTALAAAALTIFSRLPVFREDRSCRIHNLICHSLLQLLLWAALSSDRGAWEMAAGCLILLLFTAKIVYESLAHMKRTGNHILPLISCVLMTVNAVDVLHKTPLGSYGILTSLTCLLAAGFCIVLGFSCRVKPLRTYGLILVIFSVLKMVTFDIASTDSIIRVAAFIGGGLLCFGISWAYNRAEKEDSGEK